MMKQSSQRLLAIVCLASLYTTAFAGQPLKIEDHSLPNAVVKTYHVHCQPARFVVIHLDPNQPQVCGVSQDANGKRLCVPRPEQDAFQAVRNLALALCQ